MEGRYRQAFAVGYWWHPTGKRLIRGRKGVRIKKHKLIYLFHSARPVLYDKEIGLYMMDLHSDPIIVLTPYQLEIYLRHWKLRKHLTGYYDYINKTQAPVVTIAECMRCYSNITNEQVKQLNKESKEVNRAVSKKSTGGDVVAH